MLDLDDPQTPHIFAASTQIELILEDCKKMTLTDARRRRFLLADVRPALAALLWLARERFADARHLPEAIAEWERQIEQLAQLPLRRPGQWIGSASPCPACEAAPNEPCDDEQLRYCSRCLGTIMPGLMRVQSIEEGFATDAI